jgi:glucan-binding YG repeat protein
MKHKTGRKLLSFLLTLAMAVGLMPGMGLTAFAANSNEGWTDCYPEDGQYVIVCKTDPSKVLTYYDYNYQFSDFTGDPGQKWSLERVPGEKFYKITFGGKSTMDVPCWEKDMNYGDKVSTVSYSSYSKFSENETNVFRFSQRDGGPSGDQYAIRVVSEAEEKWDYVLEGDVSASYGALKVGQYSDNNSSQSWSFIAVAAYKDHEHNFTYEASGDTVTATCDNEEGLCLLANKQSVLKITPPSDLGQGGNSSDAEKQAQLTGIDGKGFTETNVGDIIYYAATVSDSGYTKTGSPLPGAPTAIGDYVAEVTVTVDGQKYTAYTGYSLIDLTVIGTGADAADNLPTNSYYNYSWSQQIYTKDEINKSGNILAVDFYNSGIQMTRKLEVYMIETDKDTFSGESDWVSISSDSKVFSGNVGFTPNKWTSIKLDTPFAFSGTKNLLLCVRDMTGNYGDGLKCKVSNVSGKAIYVSQDSEPYNISSPVESGSIPNIRNDIRLFIIKHKPTNVTVTFKVVNGSWDEGEGEAAKTDKTVTLTGHDGDTLKLTADQIPAVGSKPNDTYKAGSWDTTPSADTEITADTTYTYTYAQKDSISQTVTFKVVNGSWNDETTTDKTVTLTGYEGDTLKLTADQIPAVGTKPGTNYRVGSWNVTPSANTAITADTTYIYTYAQKDTISRTVTFKVVNGSWNDETATDKTVTLTGYEGDTLKLAANQIPAVGDKPGTNYKAGSWDVTPSAETEITAATTYTYTYAQKDTISQTVTFKVANGSWNDETTADKTVTLTGYEGDTLKLAADQIPAVGTKPNDTYKAGSWDVTPSTETEITAATTYTYTYVAKEASVVTKAPEAKTLTYNGQAQELVTAGTATGGEMQYALGNENGATQPYTTSIPAKTDAGTYYVWYKAVGDSDHSDSEAKAITVDIRKKTDSHTHDIRLVESKEPTCTGNGYKKHYECTECEAWFQDRTGVSEITDKSGYTIKAIGHKWGAYEVTKRPTYDEEGLRVCTCENDPSHTKEETIPKLTSSSSSDSDSDSGSSGGSGSKNNNVSKQVIDVNGNVKSNVPSNHQVESGVPASDVGGRWANSADADTWTYTKSDGTLAKSEWMSLDYNGLRYWYYFDASGNMQTNWFDYNGKKFYLMPDKDGWRGRMATGWKKIDNKWYYFDITPGETQGSMYTAAITPDGHTVGADGAWNGVGATPVGQE